jgi:hypothetical protein
LAGSWRRMNLEESLPRKDGTGKMFWLRCPRKVFNYLWVADIRLFRAFGVYYWYNLRIKIMFLPFGIEASCIHVLIFFSHIFCYGFLFSVRKIIHGLIFFDNLVLIIPFCHRELPSRAVYCHSFYISTTN